MSIRRMEKSAADNEYFHRDFHISGDRGLRYVGENFGDEAVTEYLTRFTLSYYAPLIEKIKSEGLSVLKEHIEKIYAAEKAADNVKCVLSENALSVQVSECPAVKYMKESEYEPSRWYIELTRTVNAVIAEKSGCGFSMISYDEVNGAAEYRIFKDTEEIL